MCKIWKPLEILPSAGTDRYVDIACNFAEYALSIPLLNKIYMMFMPLGHLITQNDLTFSHIMVLNLLLVNSVI